MTTLRPMTPSPFAAANGPSARRPNTAPQFGQAFTKAVPGMAANPVSGFMKAFDFQELGASNLSQIKLIYGLCILSRVYNAAKRSKNEVREVLTRDSLGFAFWFYATPMIQRAFLKRVAPKELRDALIQQAPNPTTANTWREMLKLGSLKEQLQFASWKLNPLTRWSIPSSHQVKDQMAQALSSMERAGHKRGGEAFMKMETYYKQLLKWRNLSTGLGWAVTIGLLGIGINLYNIYLTNKKMAANQAGQG